MDGSANQAASAAETLEHASVLGGVAAALIQGDDYFGAVLDVLPAAVYITDADGLITYYNDAAAELWGRRPKLGEALVWVVEAVLARRTAVAA